MSAEPAAEEGCGESADLRTLRRWEASGSLWRVLSRSTNGLEIALMTCTAGEEVERVVTASPDAVAHVGERETSEE